MKEYSYYSPRYKRSEKRALLATCAAPLPPPVPWTMAYVPNFNPAKAELTVYVWQLFALEVKVWGTNRGISSC